METARVNTQNTFRLFFFLLIGLNSMANEIAEGISLRIEPMRNQVIKGAPLAFEYIFKNVGGKSVWIPIDHGCNVKFSSKSPFAKPRKIEISLIDARLNSHGETREFKPDSEIRFLRYPNQDLQFRDLGIYEIQSEVALSAYMSVGADYPKIIRWKRNNEIALTGGSLDEFSIQDILKRWDGSDARAHETIEGLSYVEKPFVILSMVKLARDYPPLIPNTAIALKKFLGTPEGINALQQLGSQFQRNEKFIYDGEFVLKDDEYGINALESAFTCFRQMNAFPNKDFIRIQLGSDSQPRVVLTLEYLLAGDAQHLIAEEDLHRLRNSGTPEIQRLAEKLSDKGMKKREENQF